LLPFLELHGVGSVQLLKHADADVYGLERVRDRDREAR